MQINNEFTILFGKAFILIFRVKIDNHYKEFYWSPKRHYKTRCTRCSKKL